MTRGSEHDRELRWRITAWLTRLFSTLWGRIAVLVTLIALFSLVGGAIARYALDDFTSYGPGVWWAFTHLLDPSALLDDQGFEQRLLGTILVVAGLVFLLGILFTILVEAVESSMLKLSAQDFPLGMRNHLVIIGWNDIVPDIAMNTADAYSARDMAKHHRLDKVAILAPDHLREHRLEMEQTFRDRCPSLQAELRFGNPASMEGFELVSAADAWAIFVALPSGGNTSPMVGDADNIRIALALGKYLEANQRSGEHPNPTVALGFYWGENVDAAVEVMPPQFQGVVWDRIFSGIMLTGLTNIQWARALQQVIDSNQQDLYVISEAWMTGEKFANVAAQFEGALPIGVLHSGAGGQEAIIPDADHLLQDGNGIVLYSHDGPPIRAAKKRDQNQVQVVDLPLDVSQMARTFKLLIVGANHRVGALLYEFSTYPEIQAEIYWYSAVPEDLREDMQPAGTAANIKVNHLRGVFGDLDRLKSTVEKVEPEAIAVTGDWTESGGADAVDAEGALSFLHVKRIVEGKVPILAISYSSTYADILNQGTTAQVSLDVADYVSRVAARVLIWPEEILLYNNLFGGQKTRLITSVYQPSDGKPVRFDALYQGILHQHGILFGLTDAEDRPILNPTPETLVQPGTTLLVIVPVELVVSAAS